MVKGPARAAGRVLLGLVCAVLCLAAWDGPTAGRAAPAAFAVGQPVVTQGAGHLVNLREGPGLSSPVRAALPSGTTLTVIGGPQAADGTTWWELDGAAGWGMGRAARAAAGQGAH
jgi:hypothetical protein